MLRLVKHTEMFSTEFGGSKPDVFLSGENVGVFLCGMVESSVDLRDATLFFFHLRNDLDLEVVGSSFFGRSCDKNVFKMEV